MDIRFEQDRQRCISLGTHIRKLNARIEELEAQLAEARDRELLDAATRTVHDKLTPAPSEPAVTRDDDLWIPWKYGDPVPEGRVRVKKAQGVCWPDYDNGWNWGPISSITAYLPEALEYDLEAMEYDPEDGDLEWNFRLAKKTPEGFDYWRDKYENGLTPEAEWKLNEMKRQWEAKNMPEAPDHMTPVEPDSASYLRKLISDLQFILVQERANVQDEEMQTSYWKRRAEKAEDALRTVHGVIKRTDLV